ncbi:BA75_01467T0 [Komagataella pastoris]|uniref:BA75_01467T0 n=1 Tax=Komagataella pastoris TaxID=4922 RepID=A0A1B2J950_PICPA|nr:BA75_01467T0 [Komagataella pastoris]
MAKSPQPCRICLNNQHVTIYNDKGSECKSIKKPCLGSSFLTTISNEFMRDSNYKSVSSNRAAVSITTSLYDRRALDCTSDKPLVNSLNHLTFLLSTSGKVRETVSTDGGLERLIDILQECQQPESPKHWALVGWKWTLTFQSLVFIGTRGTEKIRRKVVQAGIIPILATILDNYLYQASKGNGNSNVTSASKTPIIESGPVGNVSPADAVMEDHTIVTTGNEMNINELPLELNSIDDIGESKSSVSILNNNNDENPLNSSINDLLDDKLSFASFLTDLNEGAGNTSQELLDYVNLSDLNDSIISEVVKTPAINNILSNMNRKSILKEFRHSTQLRLIRILYPNASVQFPRVFKNGILVPTADDVLWSLQLLAFISKYSSLRNELSNTFIIKGMSLRAKEEGTKQKNSPLHNNITLPALEMDDDIRSVSYEEDIEQKDRIMMDVDPAFDDNNPLNDVHQYLNSYEKSQGLAKSTEYIKCKVNLDCLIQHELVKLKKRNSDLLKEEHEALTSLWCYDTYDFWQEDGRKSQDLDPAVLPYMQLNIFPLVEKFTIKSEYLKDISYWSGVIMRNSCRKDETRGGVRQCACISCGKWETMPKQFAKCRRCKRTKYCSKECQSKAWEYHKHWCVAVQSGSSASSSVNQCSSQNEQTSSQTETETQSQLSTQTQETPQRDDSVNINTQQTSDEHQLDHGSMFLRRRLTQAPRFSSRPLTPASGLQRMQAYSGESSDESQANEQTVALTNLLRNYNLQLEEIERRMSEVESNLVSTQREQEAEDSTDQDLQQNLQNEAQSLQRELNELLRAHQQVQSSFVFQRTALTRSMNFSQENNTSSNDESNS